MAKGLRDLQAKKIIRALPDGSVRSLAAGFHAMPPTSAMLAEDLKRTIRAYDDKMLKSRGARAFEVVQILRAAEPTFAAYYEHLDRAVRSSTVYSLEHKEQGSALFLVRAFVHRLFPF